MHPRNFVRDTLGFAATQYIIRALLVVRMVVAARLLGPLSYGAWNALQLLMDYGTTLPPMGTQHGLDQRVPGLIVEKDPSRLERLERAGLFNILVLTGLFAAIGLLVVLLRPNHVLDFWGAGGLLVAVLVVLLVNLSSYHMSLLRSHGNIRAVSGWFLIQGVIGTALGLALIPTFGAPGLLAGWAGATVIAALSVRIQGRHVVPLVPRAGPESLELIRVGLPLFVFSASSQVMRSFDRLVILKFLGNLSLGYYSLSVNALNFVMYLPDSIAYVLYPRLVTQFRQSGGHPAAIREPVERALRTIAVIVPALCGVTYLCAREAVLTVLPKFLPGVTPVRVLCFGAGGLALANLSSIVLMTLGRQNVLVPVAVGMTALGGALDYLAVRMGFGINGVARMTLITYVVDGALLLWLAYGGLGVPRRDHPDLPLGLLLLRLAAGIGMFGVLYAAAVTPMVRGLGLRQVLREFNLMLPRARGAEASGGGGRPRPR